MHHDEVNAQREFHKRSIYKPLSSNLLHGAASLAQGHFSMVGDRTALPPEHSNDFPLI